MQRIVDIIKIANNVNSAAGNITKYNDVKVGEDDNLIYDAPMPYVLVTTPDKMGLERDTHGRTSTDNQKTVLFLIKVLVQGGKSTETETKLYQHIKEITDALENNKRLTNPNAGSARDPLCTRLVILPPEHFADNRGKAIQGATIALQLQIGNDITITIPGIANPIPLISKPVSREYVTYAPHLSTSGELSGYAATSESKTRYYEIEDNIQYRNTLNDIKNSKEKIRYRVNDDIIDGYLSAVNPSYNYDGLPLVTLQFEVISVIRDTTNSIIIGYKNKIKLTVSSSKVIGDANLINIPLVCVISNEKIIARVDGNDFLVTDENGTIINHDVESWDNISHKLIIHFKAPILKDTEDAIFYLHFNNPGLPYSKNNGNAVFSEYIYVWYMDGTKSARGVIDSINHYTEDTEGRIGRARIFGTYDVNRIIITSSISGVLSNLVISAWVYMDGNLDSHDPIFFNRHNDDIATGFGVGKDNSLVVNWKGMHHSVDWGLTIPDKTWVFVCAKFSQENTITIFLSDGDTLRKVSKTLDVPPTTMMGYSYIGLDTYNRIRRWQGKIDQLQLSKNAFSDEYIETIFKNQYNTDSFFVVGEVE